MLTPPTGQLTDLLRAWSHGDGAALERLLPLVEAERRRLACGYMGRERQRVTMNDVAVSDEPDLDVLALDGALDELATLDARKCQVIELRFFGGLSVAETAEVLVVS